MVYSAEILKKHLPAITGVFWWKVKERVKKV